MTVYLNKIAEIKKCEDSICGPGSVRSYDSRTVSKDTIATIIEAGNQAPSAMNSQPWRFVVVEDKEVRKKLLRAALPNAKKILDHVKDTDPERYGSIMKRYNELEDPIYYSAPVVLFVTGSGRYADSRQALAVVMMRPITYLFSRKPLTAGAINRRFQDNSFLQELLPG